MAIKRDSVTFIFLKYLLVFILAASIIFAGFGAYFVYSINKGIILPANYIETYIRNNKGTLEKGIIDYREIPYPGRYLVLDSQGNQIDTNMDLEHLQDYEALRGGDKNRVRYFYRVIQREDEEIIVQYDLEPHYGDENMDKILPNPEIIFAFLPIFLNILLAVWISIRFKKKIKKEIDGILYMTEEIKAQNLNIIPPISAIAEFNEVIDSLDSMKDALQKSLEDQWNMEKEKFQQISSISHDINTPLAIIKGSTELRMEEKFSPYDETILQNIKRIEEYLTILKKQTLNKGIILESRELVKAEAFAKSIEEETSILCRQNQRQFYLERKDLAFDFRGNPEELKRAVLNLLNNSIRYTKPNGRIELFFSKEGEDLRIEVRDNGTGFSEEALERGKEVYYSEDKYGGDHLGMGLAIAEKIAKDHRGDLVIKNLPEGGAVASIRIPILNKE